MWNRAGIGRLFLLCILLITLLLSEGCLYGPFASHRVHKTPFNNGWEIVRLESVGVDIELPVKPRRGIPYYEIKSNFPDEADINMHPKFMSSMHEWIPMLSLYIYRQNSTEHRESIKDNNGMQGMAGILWDTENLFAGIQQKHVLLRKGVPPETDTYRWDFLKCYKDPNDDVIIVNCVYVMDEEEDIKAIERMMNSVRPFY